MSGSQLILRGNRCRCPACGEAFNSTCAFDQHRTGDYGAIVSGRLVDSRRCLTLGEMGAAGFAKNGAGYWVSSRMPAVGRV